MHYVYAAPSSFLLGILHHVQVVLSKQVLENKPISKQCDVYSYGIVVWELLTHKIPFEDVTDLLQICQRVAANKEVGNHSNLARPLPTSSIFASGDVVRFPNTLCTAKDLRTDKCKLYPKCSQNCPS